MLLLAHKTKSSCCINNILYQKKYWAQISKDEEDLESRVNRMVFVQGSAFCPRSQKFRPVQKCHSYQLTPPG